MTLFSDATARVHERINAAPVEEWLKSEACNDLRRLIEAHELMLAEQRELKDPFVENVEAALREYVPSDFELRRMALDMAVHRFAGTPGHADAAAREYYKFLKGE